MAPEVDPDVPEPGLSRGQLAKALEREERIAAALRDVGSALGATHDLDELLAFILSRLQQLVEAERAELFLLDDQGQELTVRASTLLGHLPLKVPVGEGLVGRVARSGRSHRIDDARRDPRYDARWDSAASRPTRCALAAPLKNNLGRTIGVLKVVNRRSGGPFTEEDEAILTALGTQAAVAIDNFWLLQSLVEKNVQLNATKRQLERRVRDLELLFELERSTAQAASHEDLARAVLGRLAQACDARGAGLLLRDAETRELIEYTLDVEVPGIRARGPVTEGPLFEVMIADAPFERTRAMTPAIPERASGFFKTVETFIAQPMEGEAAALGALALFNKQGAKDFSEEDSGLLRLVSANLSTAVRLFDANREREREERLSSIGRLLSQVIHDFRSPMTVISGYVQLMEESDDPAQRRRYAEEILHQFAAVASMQREVLAFARGERDVFVRRVYVGRFLTDLARQLQHELEERNVRLELQVEPKLVARFDADRITRALFNLARNAMEAMGDHGGRLIVQAYRDEAKLVLAVEDTGPGIPEAVRARLFQSFVTANKEGGTGLGLAIVKRIVDQHGGTISVASSSKGARFELRLPGLFEADEGPKSIEPPMKATPGPRKSSPPATSSPTEARPARSRAPRKARKSPRSKSSTGRRSDSTGR